ncbi:hypothetical protein GCM10027276_10630 [Comamonas piscis]
MKKRNLWIASAAMAWQLTGTAQAAEPPALAEFATGDGAYYTTLGGQVVDPYFINKGFTIALQADVPLKAELRRWLAWLLPRQRVDGGFDRFCPAGDNSWRSCMGADADDSMAATTIEMLHQAQQKKWLTSSQLVAADQAIARSQQLLTRLRNPKNQLYKALLNTELYYLMDNIEVYEALRVTEGAQAGPASKQLAAAINRNFRSGSDWKPALPEYDRSQFYPHTLASAYLWQTGVISRAESDRATAQWLAQHGRAWLSRSEDDYAWGLVAWKMRQTAPIQAACWRASLRPFQPAVGWTVLDAMIDQALAHTGIGTQCPFATATATAPATPSAANP